jgi:hypothetical protein
MPDLQLGASSCRISQSATFRRPSLPQMRQPRTAGGAFEAPQLGGRPSLFSGLSGSFPSLLNRQAQFPHLVVHDHQLDLGDSPQGNFWLVAGTAFNASMADCS